jgi:hypothetical protein
MPKALDTTTLENLRAFANEHGMIPFAHLVTQALGQQPWAVERVTGVVRAAISARELSAEAFNAQLLAMMRATDCTAPDGAVMRKLGGSP